MVIKNINLETVCGITSVLPEMISLRLHLQENQCRKIITDQCTDEP